MSGTQRTAELVGTLVRATPEAAKHTAKILRSAGVRPELWPSPGRGVRNATFTPTHLVNLLLALGCGDPIRAVDTVAAFRNLRTDDTVYRTHTRREKLNALMMRGDGYQEVTTRTTSGTLLLPGPTFGAVLDLMVEKLASADMPATLRADLRAATIVATIEPYPSAEIFLPLGDITDSQRYRMHPQQIDLTEGSVSALHRAFYGTAIETLATVWNDAKALRKTGLPANETAASPGREAAAARDQPAEADGCSVQAHPTGEREKSQSPSVSRLGHSQQLDWKLTDAEERKAAAFDAAA